MYNAELIYYMGTPLLMFNNKNILKNVVCTFCDGLN